MNTFTNLFKFHSWSNRKRFFSAVFAIVIIFACAYMVCDWFEEQDADNNTTMFAYNSVPNKEIYQKICNKIYVSISTLTTLGYGDIYPRHPLTQAIVACQTFITFMLITDIL